MEHARSAAVYRELRAILGPWAKDNGYQRQPRTEASWSRRLGNGEELVLRLRCNALGRRRNRRRQTAIQRSGRDVVVGEGAWLASHALVLGPCRIGEHAVVAAGSLVTRDVAPYTLVAGRPATLVRRIEQRDVGE